MEQFLNNLSAWFQQAWVYIPAILSFISAIGLPSLVQIAKIFTSAKLYLQNTKTIKDKVNVVINTVNQFNKACDYLVQVQVQNLAEELHFLELQKALTYNKKMQELIEQRIEQIKQRIEDLKKITIGDIIKQIEDTELASNKKATKKVKVKVVKK